MLNAWEDYVEELCRKHKDIRHEKMDGTKTRRSFFPWAAGESPVANSNAASPYVSHWNFYGVGRRQTQWLYTSELAVLVNISSKNQATEVNEARAKALSIAQQLEAKILEDYELGGACAFIEDLLEPVLTPIDLVDQAAYGWQLTIKFAKDKPVVDIAKWEE